MSPANLYSFNNVCLIDLPSNSAAPFVAVYTLSQTQCARAANNSVQIFFSEYVQEVFDVIWRAYASQGGGGGQAALASGMQVGSSI